MTIPQMADVAGVSPETIRRKVKELYPERVINGKKTNLPQKEATVLLAEVRKLNFVTPTQSEEVPTQIVEVVRQIVLALVPAMAEAMRIAIGGKSKSTTALPIPSLSTPVLTPRDELRRIVSDAASETRDFQETWGRLYLEIYYRLHINAKERAKNAGVSALDILETEGLLSEAIAIAREIF